MSGLFQALLGPSESQVGSTHDQVATAIVERESEGIISKSEAQVLTEATADVLREIEDAHDTSLMSTPDRDEDTTIATTQSSSCPGQRVSGLSRISGGVHGYGQSV